jgi:type I restriction enzyme S subunit
MNTDATISISGLAEVNPDVDLSGISGNSLVSFIPMVDVSENGQWIGRQERRLDEVRVGYTPFSEGDILFAKITPCMENGKGAHAKGLTNRIGFGSTEFHVLRPRGQTDARFLFHSLQARSTRTRAIAFMGGSAGQQRVQSEFFTHFRVPRIPPSEQCQISAVLDTVDEAIAKTEAVIAKLKMVRAGLLHDLLTRGLDEHGQLRDALAHPEQFKDSPLGRIPLGWSFGPLGNNIDLIVGPAFKSQRFSKGEDGTRLLRGVNVTQGRIRWATDIIERWPEVTPDLEMYRLEIGDVVIGMDGALVGRNVARLTPEDVPSFLVQRVARIRGLRDLDSAYAYLALVMPRFLQHTDTRKTHTAIPHITAADICEYPVAIPRPEEQSRILTVVGITDSELAAIAQELAKLMALKSGLMADLLTGRVRVPEILTEGNP